MKGLNTIFGIAVAILVYLVLILGIKAFYPPPEYEDFCDPIEPRSLFDDCLGNETVDECKQKEKANAEERNTCYQEFDAVNEEYGKNLFIITAIIGLLVIIGAMFLLNYINIAAGLIMASVVLMIYGFIVGWDSTGDMIKFIVALIDAAVVIGFAVWIKNRS